MLRVRPLHTTARIEEWAGLLTALGLVCTDAAPEWQVFDAGAGRLVLHRVPEGAADNGSTALAVEVGDPAEFVRRTNLSAREEGTTPAEIMTAGAACRISGPDGFTFPAYRAAGGEAHPAGGADPALAVVAAWFTEDRAAAARTLRHIGARPRPAAGSTLPTAFTAKNGGVILVLPTLGAPRSGLGFEYDGGLDLLQERLAAAGITAGITEEAHGRTLHVPHPDAGPAAPRVPATVRVRQAASHGVELNHERAHS